MPRPKIVIGCDWWWIKYSIKCNHSALDTTFDLKAIKQTAKTKAIVNVMTKMQFFLMSLLPNLLQSPDERLNSNCNLDKVKLTLKAIIVLMSINRQTLLSICTCSKLTCLSSKLSIIPSLVLLKVSLSNSKIEQTNGLEWLQFNLETSINCNVTSVTLCS